jgi:micrococcal nuclease
VISLSALPVGIKLAAAGVVAAVGVPTAIVVAVSAGSGPDRPAGVPSDAFAMTVGRVVDGDTFHVRKDGNDTTVRLLLVDTPETVKPGVDVQCLGPEASAALGAMLPTGSLVWGEYDKDRKDRYDRDLMYVWTSGGVMVNTALVSNGLGKLEVVQPNDERLEEVQRAQASAQRAQLGLWSPAIPCTAAKADADRIARQQAEKVAADKVAAERAAQEAARLAAEQEAAARLAADQQAAAQLAAEQEAAARQAATWQVPSAPAPRQTTQSSGSTSNPYKAPNRCYEPGGKTFHYC